MINEGRNDSQSEAEWFTDISDYATIMKRLLPRHLMKRFRKIIEMFNKVDSSFPSTESGGLSMVHGMFQYAQDAVDIVLVLFRNSQLLGDLGDAPSPKFDVEASLVFRIQCVFSWRLRVCDSDACVGTVPGS